MIFVKVIHQHETGQIKKKHGQCKVCVSESISGHLCRPQSLFTFVLLSAAAVAGTSYLCLSVCVSLRRVFMLMALDGKQTQSPLYVRWMRNVLDGVRDPYCIFCCVSVCKWKILFYIHSRVAKSLLHNTSRDF